MPALPLAFFQGPWPWVLLAAVTVFLLWVDLHFFARGREPSFREGAIWSVGWLVLSLDNLFVFLLLFSYFGVPEDHRAGLLFWGIVAALVLRGLAILGGVALLEQFHFVIYVLGVLLLVLAYRILRGVEDNVDPDKNVLVRMVRRVFPVAGDYHGTRWFVRIDHTRHVTPLFLCLVAVVAVKLLIEDVVKIGPVLSLLIVLVAFAVGIVASLIADSRDPDADRKARERGKRTTASKPEEKPEPA